MQLYDDLGSPKHCIEEGWREASARTRGWPSQKIDKASSRRSQKTSVETLIGQQPEISGVYCFCRVGDNSCSIGTEVQGSYVPWLFNLPLRSMSVLFSLSFVDHLRTGWME